jgi:hypothetical protein
MNEHQQQKAAARIAARDRALAASTPAASQTHVHSSVDGRVIDQPRRDDEPTPGSCVDRLNKAEATIAALVDEAGKLGSRIAGLETQIADSGDRISAAVVEAVDRLAARIAERNASVTQPNVTPDPAVTPNDVTAQIS